MEDEGQIPVEATYLDGAKPIEQKIKIEEVIEHPATLDSLKDTQIKELHRQMIKKGLTLDLVLSKYKDVLETKNVKYKGSDILKSLERVERLLGFSDKSEETMQVRAMVQSKSASEITTTLIEITGKTQEYIKKLTDLQEP